MPKKILVVDDEPDMLEIVKLQLQKSGYEVLTAAKKDEGLQLVSSEKPDLILLDIFLKNDDGFEICRQIKSDNPRQKVVIYTAKIDKADARKALEVGADDLTLKGDSMSGILDAIEDKINS